MFSKLFRNKSIQKGEKVKGGLGGWLIVVGAILILGIIVQAYGILINIPLLFEDFYIDGFKTVFIIELLVHSIILIALIRLLYLYFKKNKKFPKHFIIFLYALIAWGIIDYFMQTLLNSTTQELKKSMDDVLYESARDATKTFISSFIWILYMAKSKRVKATFVM